jgi:hypothetical protein
MFTTEQHLVDSFVCLLESAATPWGSVRVGREFFYARGRTDVIAVAEEGTLIAFEAKLRDWRTALDQAYRNTCFAHGSYVLLPKKAALNAIRCVGEFEKRGVGLCYVDGVGIVVLIRSPLAPPLEPWLASQALSQVQQCY